MFFVFFLDMRQLPCYHDFNETTEPQCSSSYGMNLTQKMCCCSGLSGAAWGAPSCSKCPDMFSGLLAKLSSTTGSFQNQHYFKEIYTFIGPPTDFGPISQCCLTLSKFACLLQQKNLLKPQCISQVSGKIGWPYCVFTVDLHCDIIYFRAVSTGRLACLFVCLRLAAL